MLIALPFGRPKVNTPHAIFEKGRIMLANRLILTLTIAGIYTAPAVALEIGDDAPPLEIKKWVQGDKFKLEALKNKEIVIIDFWHSDSQLCQQTVPYLTEIQKKYEDKGVRVIGISPEDLSSVMDFVETQGKKMKYTVAVDKDGKTTQALLSAFAVNEVPHTFIIDRKGKIAWHGISLHKDFEEMLDEIIEEQPYKVDKNLKQAREKYKEYYALAKKDDAPVDKLKELGGKLVELGGHDTDFMSRVASMIVKSRKIKHRDLDLALRAAEKAIELTKGKDCEINELCARVYYEKGDIDGAVKYLRKALSVCEDFDHEDQLEERIEKLKNKQPQR
jgi:peroxiredoxin